MERVVNNPNHKQKSGLENGLFDTFCNEFKEFQQKFTPFKDEYQFNFPNHDGNFHLWYDKYFLPFTQDFVCIAFRVMRKIVGIISAKQSWGDVKHIKSSKIYHLGDDKTFKQDVIY